MSNIVGPIGAMKWQFYTPNLPAQEEIASSVAALLYREHGMLERVNAVRDADLWTKEGFEWMYNSNFQKPVYTEKAKLIQNKDSEIAQKLGEYLSIKLERLFHSPGALTLLKGDGLIHDTMYKNTWWWKNSLGIWGPYESNVSLAYGDDTLIWLSQQKAAIGHLFHMLRGNYTFSSAMLQAVITIYWKDSAEHKDHPQYYRGMYSHGDISAGVSWSYVYHESIGEIIIAITWWLYRNDVNNFAPERKVHESKKEHVVPSEENLWRVDLLASIFDELYARLLLHPENEWDEHIQYTAETIQGHINAWAMEKLC